MRRGADAVLRVTGAAVGARHRRQADNGTVGAALGDQRRHVDLKQGDHPARRERLVDFAPEVVGPDRPRQQPPEFRARVLKRLLFLNDSLATRRQS